MELLLVGLKTRMLKGWDEGEGQNPGYYIEEQN